MPEHLVTQPCDQILVNLAQGWIEAFVGSQRLDDPTKALLRTLRPVFRLEVTDDRLAEASRSLDRTVPRLYQEARRED